MPGDPWAQYAVQPAQQPSSPGQDKWSPYATTSATPNGASPSFWDRVLKSKKYNEVSGFQPKGKGPEGMPGVSEGAGLAGGLAAWDEASGGEIAGGVGDILRGDVSKGLHRMFVGTGHAMTPALPLMAPGMAAAPLATGLTIGGGAVGGAAAKTGAEALGASPEQAQVAGDVGQLAGGIGTSKALSGVAKLRNLWDAIPEETQKTLLKSALGMASPRISHAVEFGKSAKQGYEALQSVVETLRKMPEADLATTAKSAGLKWQASDSPDTQLVTVDTNKLDAAWAKDKGFYVEPGTKGGRVDRFHDWQTKNPDTPIKAPQVGLLEDGRVGFDDGRHRFAALRDQGVPEVQVEVDKRQAADFQKLFAPSKTPSGFEAGKITPQGWYYLGRMQEIAKGIEAEESAAAGPKNVTPSRAAALKNPVTPAASSNDLTSLLEESLKRVRAAKGQTLADLR